MKKIAAIFSLTFCFAAAVAQNAPTDASQPIMATSMVSSAMKVSDVVINPNPVRGQTFSLEIQNLDKGKYSIYAFDNNGKKYTLKVLNLEEGSSTQLIDLPKDLASGTYILQVISKSSRYIKKMIVE